MKEKFHNSNQDDNHLIVIPKHIHLPLLKNHPEPSMRYESLARAAFNCPKGGDPWGYAMQQNYDLFFVPGPKLEGKRALSTVLCKLIYDNKGSKHNIELKKLDDEIWDATATEQISDIIDKTLAIAAELGY